MYKYFHSHWSCQGKKGEKEDGRVFLIIQKEKNGYDIYINNTEKHLYDNFSVK